MNFEGLEPLTSSSLSLFLCVVGNVISQLWSALEDCCHAFPAVRDLFSGIESLDKLFLPSADFVYFLTIAIKIKIHSPATKLNFINCSMSKTNKQTRTREKISKNEDEIP